MKQIKAAVSVAKNNSY